MRVSFIFCVLFGFVVPAFAADLAPVVAPPLVGTAPGAPEQGARRLIQDSTAITKLTDIRAQDVCILPDPAWKTYYMIAAGGGGVRGWTSQELVNGQGPKAIFR